LIATVIMRSTGKNGFRSNGSIVANLVALAD
jgi:hypothetical protein